MNPDDKIEVWLKKVENNKINPHKHWHELLALVRVYREATKWGTQLFLDTPSGDFAQKKYWINRAEEKAEEIVGGK